MGPDCRAGRPAVMGPVSRSCPGHHQCGEQDTHLCPAGRPARQVPGHKKAANAKEPPSTKGHQMINIDHLTKRYGSITAVDGLSFEVGPGRVTGFLGPNGAGKTTTLRMLLGLAAPDDGTATIDGVRYRDLPDPVRTVGAALDNDCFHPGRSAAEHLRILATAAGI